MVGAEGASSGQQRGRDLLGPLNTTSILTSESQLALSDPCPSAQNSTWLDHPQVEHTHQTFFYFLATVSAEENNFFQFSSRGARMLRFALNSLESVRRSVDLYMSPGSNW